ncbi:MAG: MetQ/NlpA family ABC transporter substrate-binding protein [Selenomonadaceae bacterium]|nr:MetQ/NlpA family ABC transporter substrate-binding protein [Selenomonadaceae bacterium]MBP3721814.1 MetQ/NlpA family ABC transporter substrate-binding protein [Selenomonadaceae bacterium]
MKRILLAILSILSVSLLALGCGGDKSGGKTIKVGATAVPHAEILEVVKPVLEKDGVKLEIVEFNDYVQPNLSLNDKELDANFFQHKPYLDNFVEEHKECKLVSAAGIHIEPMGVYSRKVKKLDELKDGAIAAIPSDPTNGGRALLLLAKQGLFKLKDGVNEKATVQDIVENKKNIVVREIEAAQLPRTLDDVDIAVINSNFAMQVDLVPTRDAIAIEGNDSPYVNIIAVRAGDENRKEIVSLIKAVKSDEVKKFIEDKYKGAVVPAF